MVKASLQTAQSGAHGKSLSGGWLKPPRMKKASFQTLTLNHLVRAHYCMKWLEILVKVAFLYCLSQMNSGFQHKTVFDVKNWYFLTAPKSAVCKEVLSKHERFLTWALEDSFVYMYTYIKKINIYVYIFINIIFYNIIFLF